MISFLCFFRRGSPMVIGVKCADQLAHNHIPVLFSKGKYCLIREIRLKSY